MEHKIDQNSYENKNKINNNFVWKSIESNCSFIYV